MPGADDEYSTAVLDASVAVRWLVNERGSDQAAALLGRRISWVAPRLILTEVGGALRRKVSGAELEPDAAVERLDALLSFIDGVTIRLIDDERIVSSALRLSLSLGHNVADCLYLALAERDGVALYTADVALARIAIERGVAAQLLPSS
jgi:predicted nucleic acid-binding protein